MHVDAATTQCNTAAVFERVMGHGAYRYVKNGNAVRTGATRNVPGVNTDVAHPRATDIVYVNQREDTGGDHGSK